MPSLETSKNKRTIEAKEVNGPVGKEIQAIREAREKILERIHKIPDPELLLREMFKNLKDKEHGVMEFANGVYGLLKELTETRKALDEERNLLGEEGYKISKLKNSFSGTHDFDTKKERTLVDYTQGTYKMMLKDIRTSDIDTYYDCLEGIIRWFKVTGIRPEFSESELNTIKEIYGKVLEQENQTGSEKDRFEKINTILSEMKLI